MCLQVGLTYDAFCELKVSTLLDILITSINREESKDEKDNVRKATKDDNIMFFF